MDPYETPARRISSAWTPIYKIVFPVLWIGGMFGFFLVADEFKVAGAVTADRWLFAVMMLVALVMVSWFFIRLKWVDLQGDMLVISDVQRKITVPLHDVERFSGSILISPELIWIHFLRPTEFGDKVVFLAPWRLLQGFNPHPLVAKLNDLRTEAGPSPWNTEHT